MGRLNTSSIRRNARAARVAGLEVRVGISRVSPKRRQYLLCSDMAPIACIYRHRRGGSWWAFRTQGSPIGSAARIVDWLDRMDRVRDFAARLPKAETMAVSRARFNLEPGEKV